MRATIPLILAALLAVSCSNSGDAAPDDGVTAPSPLGALRGGTPLPAAELPDLDGDGALRIPDDLAGEPAVLNFWATWCAFCVEEMPDIEEVHRQLRGQVTFVGIDQDDSVDMARTLAERTGVTYRLVVDDDGSYFRSVQGRGMPTTVFIDPDGTIVHRHSGPLDVASLRGLIREHLDVDVPAPAATS